MHPEVIDLVIGSNINNQIINEKSTKMDQTDPFGGNVEPTIYMSENRMPVMIEFNNTIIYIIFSALILALLFILPGVRKTKFTSLIGIVTLLTVGATILLALEGTNWLTGSINIHDFPYSSLTSETISGKLEVNIGLNSANITLIGKLMGVSRSRENQVNEEEKNVDYNERFHWHSPDIMAQEHVEALYKGLPYPILTVSEFLSQDSEGFNWMRQLRQAGYYSSLVLYLSLASWALTTVVICVLPVYLPHMMQITGALMMLSVWFYTILIESPESFAFQMGARPVEFAFGSTYLTTFVTGAMSTFAGLILLAIQMSKPNKQITIMDSEQYVNDQKALKSISIVPQKTNSLKADERSFQHSNSVIIPMKDIEENFNKI